MRETTSKMLQTHHWFPQRGSFQNYMDPQGHLVGNEDSSIKKNLFPSLHIFDNDIIDLQQVPSHSHSAPIDCWNTGIVFHFKCNKNRLSVWKLNSVWPFNTSCGPVLNMNELQKQMLVSVWPHLQWNYFNTCKDFPLTRG